MRYLIVLAVLLSGCTTKYVKEKGCPLVPPSFPHVPEHCKGGGGR